MPWAITAVIVLQLASLAVMVYRMARMSASLDDLKRTVVDVQSKGPFSGYTLTDMARAKMRAHANGEGRPKRLPSLTGGNP